MSGSTVERERQLRVVTGLWSAEAVKLCDPPRQCIRHMAQYRRLVEVKPGQAWPDRCP